MSGRFKSGYVLEYGYGEKEMVGGFWGRCSFEGGGMSVLVGRTVGFSFHKIL